ncbi:MAG: DegT/DnrJ/EryC1/StrS family aminotransferase [Candidatus Levybacteria bacterium]|nr:DegT/DnrJ/EryC1/StrS family aminotransferase [Candidatus Levybacteria bacterium]
MIPLVKPFVGPKEYKAVARVLESGMLAQDKEVKAFEEAFADYIGVKHAVATSSGSTALHLTLLAAGINPGSSVITSPLSFIASSNAILFAGGKPVFADIDERTYTIDPKRIEQVITKHTRAILPVDIYGLPANMDEILRIAKKHNLLVIEDACQAHGAKIGKKKAGSFGLAGCFSFYPTKNMTTGEGGIITTNDTSLARKVRLLRNQGAEIKYHHKIVGYNFRMTEIAAAIGREQLKKLEARNRKRQQNAAFLTKHLANIPGIITPLVPEYYTHALHQYTILVTNPYPLTRDELMNYLARRRIGSGIYYPVPLHRQEAYKTFRFGSFPVTEKVTKEILSIPVHPGLSQKDLNYIVETIQTAK